MTCPDGSEERWRFDGAGILFAIAMVVFTGMPIPAGAQDAGAVETRLKDLENRVEALEHRLEKLGPAGSGKTGVAGAELPAGETGWLVVVHVQDADDVRRRENAVGQFVQAAGRFTLGEARANLAEAPPPPVTFRRQAVFQAREAGYHRIGLELIFPPVGFGGLLAGFECHIDMTIDDRSVLETVVRMPYGLRNRVKEISGSERLDPGLHRVEQWIACRPDGRQSADPGLALDAIGVRDQVKRPPDRRMHEAVANDFLRPAE